MDNFAIIQLLYITIMKDSFSYPVFFFFVRPGSVVAEFKLLFKRKVSEEKAVAPLKKAVEDGNLGPLTVDPDSLKIMKNVEGNFQNVYTARIEYRHVNFTIACTFSLKTSHS